MVISVYKASAKEGSHMTVVSHKITTFPPSFLIYKLCCTVQFSDSDVLPIHFLRRKCSKCVLAVIMDISFQIGNDTTQCQPVSYFRKMTAPTWVSRIMKDWQMLFTLAVVSRLFCYWYFKSCREGAMNPHQTASQQTMVSGYSWCMTLEFLSHCSSSRKSSMMQISCSPPVHSCLFKRLIISCSDNVVYHFRCMPQNSCVGGNRLKIWSSGCSLFSATWVFWVMRQSVPWLVL